MQLTTALLLIPYLPSTILAYESNHIGRPRPRSLDAVLVEPQETETQSLANPFLRSLDLRSVIPKIPHLKQLDIRQQAPAAPVAPAAGQNAQANAKANAGANVAAPNKGTDPDAQQVAGGQAAGGAPVAPAANAPIAGVGGGGAPAAPQPGANAGQANPVTVITVATVVGGVTKQVPQTFTQSQGAGVSAPQVKTGSIGMGTLTGNVGVVKTDNAKSEGVTARDGMSTRWAMLGILGSWTIALVTGGAVLGARLI